MPKATCSEPGCRQKPRGRGLCKRHYGIAYRRGTLPPKQLMLGVHSLTNIDHAARTADCSICGPQVPIQVRKRKEWGGVACLAGARENKRQWAARQGRTPGRRAAVTKYNKYTKYNLTQDDYDRMLAEQQGCCAICRTEPPMLVVDHDHVTGVVRGLLCRNCNLGIGLLRDDVDVLSSAVQYLMADRSQAA